MTTLRISSIESYKNSNAPEVDADFMPDVFYNTHLNMELGIPRDGDRPDFVKATKRLRDTDGMPIGRSHNNPILDTRMCGLEYKNGKKVSLSANAIAENMFAQLDSKGNRHVLFQEIVDHRYNGTKEKEQDTFILTRNVTKHRIETTRGFEVLAQ